MEYKTIVKVSVIEEKGEKKTVTEKGMELWVSAKVGLMARNANMTKFLIPEDLIT